MSLAIDTCPRAAPRSGAMKFSRNMALMSLSPQAAQIIEPHLHHQECPAGHHLWAAGSPVERVYFPLRGVIQVEQPAGGSSHVAVALVGRDSACGAIGQDTLRSETAGVVLTETIVAWISAASLNECARMSGELARMRDLTGRWLMTQARHAAASAAVRTVPARTAAYLLQLGDRLGDRRMNAIQDVIANTLGVRRTTVTIAMQEFAAAGIITYRRGRITIEDRASLLAESRGGYAPLAPECWPFAGRGAQPS